MKTHFIQTSSVKQVLFSSPLVLSGHYYGCIERCPSGARAQTSNKKPCMLTHTYFDTFVFALRATPNTQYERRRKNKQVWKINLSNNWLS
jgi:hypothetical protein